MNCQKWVQVKALLLFIYYNNSRCRKSEYIFTYNNTHKRSRYRKKNCPENKLKISVIIEHNNSNIRFKRQKYVMLVLLLNNILKLWYLLTFLELGKRIEANFSKNPQKLILPARFTRYPCFNKPEILTKASMIILSSLFEF